MSKRSRAVPFVVPKNWLDDPLDAPENMKRPRDEEGAWSVRAWAAALQQSESDGASSLLVRAQTLEGALWRFARTVRRERHQALEYADQTYTVVLIDEDDEEEIAAAEEEDEVVPMKGAETKKMRHKKEEAWKEDHASYNVPFVGTSSSTMNLPDYTVQNGEWPTGLLQAYLVKSPRAAEFLDDSLLPLPLLGPTAMNRKSNIHQALLEKQKDDTEDNKERYRSLSQSLSQAYWWALSELLTAALSPFQLLVLETPDPGRPEATTTTAGEMPRFLTECLLPRLPGLFSAFYEKENATLRPVLLTIFTHLAAISTSLARTVARALEPNHSSRSAVLRSLYTYPSGKNNTDSKNKVFTAALRLLVTLLQQADDPVVLSCIASGEKSILWGALHRGLPSGGAADPNDARDEWIGRFWQEMRLTLLRVPTMNAANQRYMRDLFSHRDCLTRLCDVASTTSWSYEEVMAPQTTPVDRTALPVTMAAAAQRLLVLLLLDPAHSPLLRTIASSSVRSVITHTLVHWFRRQTTRVVIQCIEQVVTVTPRLYSSLLQVVSVENDDPPVLPRLHALATWVQWGPPLAACRGGDDDLLDSIVPLACRKASFVKLLQNPNPLTACAAFQLLVAVLGRGRDAAADTDFVARMANVLPPASAIAAVLSRPWINGDRSAALVRTWAGTALRAYRRLFAAEVAVDVSKWLPSAVARFLAAPLRVQRILLRTIQDYMAVQKSNIAVSFLRTILEIMLRTRSERVWQNARYIAMQFLVGIMSRNDLEAQYEAACWVDGLTKETLGEFCQHVQDAMKVATPFALELVRAWDKLHLPPPVPHVLLSVLMRRALQSLAKSTPPAFHSYLVHVVTRCLWSHGNPVPLAVLIVDASEEADAVYSAPFLPLVQYCQSLVHYNRYPVTERIQRVQRFCQWDRGSWAWLFSRPPRHYFNAQILVLAQQMIHLEMSLRNDFGGETGTLLQKTLGIALVASCREPQILEQTPLLSLRMLSRTSDTDCLWTLCCSHGLGCDHPTIACLMRDLPRMDDLMLTGSEFQVYGTLFLLYLVGDFLPGQAIGRILQYLFQWIPLVYSTSDHRVLFRLVSFFLHLPQIGNSFDIDVNFQAQLTSSLLKAWMTCGSASADFMVCQVVMEMETALCSRLLHWYSSPALYQYSSESVIRNCLETLKVRRANKLLSGNSLLPVIILSDLVHYAPVFLKVHLTMAFNKVYKNMLIAGDLDDVLCAALGCRDVLGKCQAEILSMVDLCNDRMTLISEDFEFPGNFHRLFEIISTLLQTTLYKERIDAVALVRLLNRCFQQVGASAKIDERYQSSFDKLVEVAFCVCLKPEVGVDGVATLSSMMLIFLCERLVGLLRMAKNDVHIVCVDNFSSSLQLFTWLQQLLSVDTNFDASCLEQKGVGFIIGLIKTCLRLGIGSDDTCSAEIRLNCLKLVETFIQLIQNDQFSWALLGPSIAYHAFTMVTSHSKFDVVINSNKCTDVQLQVLRILHTCLTSDESIPLDRGIWTLLLSTFQAGVDEKDVLLRIVLMEYGRHAPKNSQEIFRYPFLWGDAAGRDHSQSTWESLVESIELNRICATIEHFPAHDRFLPHLNVEVDVYRQFATIESTRRNGNDSLPYSPGFLLPLILGALSDEASSSKTRSVAVTPSAQASVRKHDRLVTQRLCERGALSLALLSLSSKCPSLRKISLGILGLLTDAVHRADAHLSASWKERPQIAMLLNSVQRAFVLRFCDEPSHNGSLLFNVPELPGFSAVFLARASLILVHPGDPLYMAVNRAFLRSEDDAGGFQDLTRLPVFVSLFCSSSDIPDQLSAERKFAITLVKDGFIDGSSYKLLVQCHCVELLMTSIESSMMRPIARSSDEVELMLSALTKIVVFGNLPTAVHLVNRLGLFSWVCSLLLGNPSNISERARLGLFSLLLALLKLARNNDALMPNEDFVTATSGLAQAVIYLSLQSQKDGRSVESKDSWHLIELACEILSLLFIDICTKVFQIDGIHLPSAIHFLSRIQHSPQHLKTAIFAVSCLPLRCDSVSTEQVVLFCEQLLASFTHMTNVDNELRFAVLQRISFLSNHIPKSDERKDIVRCLMRWRSECSRVMKLRRIWYSCLEALQFSEVDDCFEFDYCMREEKSLSSWILRNKESQ